MGASKKRKLAAILFADIVGYTALMQKDEQHASALLRHFQQQLEEKVRHHNGRIVNFYGDGALCIFQIPIEAVRCAMTLQTTFKDEPKTPVRIGIHSGTVTHEGDKIFGDSVNITSRIESMGIAEGVLLSKRVRDEVKNNPDLQLKSLGRFEFKNVEEPMEIFALANEGFVVPKRREMKGKLKKGNLKSNWLIPSIIASLSFLIVAFYFKKPAKIPLLSNRSIAVLPFENLNKTPEQRYLSDGISLDILTDLSRIEELQVISFNSSKQFRETEESTKKIGQKLNAKHLLSGSIQQDGDQLRIRVMLIDAETDQQLWADRFDRKIEDIFQIQSEMSYKIAEILKAELLPKVVARINEKPTDNIAAWQEYNQGRYLLNLRGTENLESAEQHFLKAIGLDSTFALAYAGVAQVNLILGLPSQGAQIRRHKLTTYAEKAIALNPKTADAYAVLGASNRSNFSKSISLYKKAIEFDPGNANTRQWIASAYFYKGMIDKARQEIDIAIRLDPGSKINQLVSYMFLLGEDKYEEAVNKLEQFYAHSPEIAPAGRTLVEYYSFIGNNEKAMSINTSPIFKKRTVSRDKKDLFQLQTLKAELIKDYKKADKERNLYLVENDITLLSGDVEKYIARIDSTFFILNYDTPHYFQFFPPDDSIRLHPRFQEMMQKRGFFIRPKLAQRKLFKN